MKKRLYYNILTKIELNLAKNTIESENDQKMNIKMIYEMNYNIFVKKIAIVVYNPVKIQLKQKMTKTTFLKLRQA